MKNALHCYPNNCHHVRMTFGIDDDQAFLEDAMLYVDELSLSEWYAIYEEIEAIILGLEAEKHIRSSSREDQAQPGVNRHRDFIFDEIEYPTENEFLPFWDDILCPADELLGFDE